MKHREYQACMRCIMDTSDSNLRFNSDGLCEYCQNFDQNILPNWHTDERGEKKLRAIAERIRQKIEQKNFSEFLLAPLGPTPKITVSVGLATFPEDTQIKEELINLADKAMYTAKFGGKNQTCVAEKNEE